MVVNFFYVIAPDGESRKKAKDLNVDVFIESIKSKESKTAANMALKAIRKTEESKQ